MNARLLLLAVPLLSGCFAIPPLKVRAGGGLSVESAPTIPRSSVGAFDLTVGAHPQQLIEGALERVIDVGAGYHLEAVFPGKPRHAGYLEVSAFVPLNKQRSWRLVPRLAAEAVNRGGTPEWGPGGTVGFGIESVTFANTSGVDKDPARYGFFSAWGEGGIGVDVGFTLRRFTSGFDYAFTVGLTLRSPATVGFYLSLLLAMIEGALKR
ncbi:MAG: hypothetical protein QM817_37205 [Archangium sp.]